MNTTVNHKKTKPKALSFTSKDRSLRINTGKMAQSTAAANGRDHHSGTSYDPVDCFATVETRE